jgi:hypothetical protein
MPEVPRFLPGWNTRRLTGAKSVKEFWGNVPALCHYHPKAVLLCRQMADDPTQAVHWFNPPPSLLGVDPLKAPREFSAGEVQLRDKWMHCQVSLFYDNAIFFLLYTGIKRVRGPRVNQSKRLIVATFQ